MNRRSFLTQLLATGALSGSGLLTPRAAASGFASTEQRMLVSVLLSGGPDFRHMMPPAFSETVGSVGYEYWHAMATSHGLGESSIDLQARFNQEYDLIGDDQNEFGLLKSCSWLKNMWEEGNVAIVNNVLGSSSRNHPLSILASEIGNRSVSAQSSVAPGVGGRLAELSARNVLSLTPSPRSYCYGPAESNAQARSTNRIVSAKDTRALTLFEGDGFESPGSYRNELSRNVSGYYASKGLGGTNDALAEKFLQHESTLRAIGAPINERLNSLPVPASLDRLYNSALMPLFSPEFGLQVRNLYDSLACADILNMGLASLEYKGFDSHRLQVETLEPRLNDLFGEQQAMQSLYEALPEAVSEQLVFTFSGEFGRQIRANGDGGTDHGEGTTYLIVGKPVTGGVYGEMFPESELELLEELSPEIAGLTAIERIHSLLADWHTSGSGGALFPNVAHSPLETGLDLDLILPKE